MALSPLAWMATRAPLRPSTGHTRVAETALLQPLAPPGGSFQCHRASDSPVARSADGEGAPARYLIRDRDRIYRETLRRRVRSLAIERVVTAPRSPWQSPYAERTIGSVRPACLDNVIVLHERHLRRVLRSDLDFYHRWRSSPSLETDAPAHRPVQPLESGAMVEFPDVGGLQRHYERRAA